MRAGRNWNVGASAGLEVPPQVVQRQTSLLQRSRGRTRVGVQQRKQQVDRVHLVVTQNLRLPVGVDQELPQRQSRASVLTRGLRVDGLRVPGQGSDRAIRRGTVVG